MKSMFIFGMGYVASHLAEHLRNDGWDVTGTRREASDGVIAFDDNDRVCYALSGATHVLSSVPPSEKTGDPVVNQYCEAIANRELEFSGYLSSTGVYGDVDGAWVDESAPIGSGRRKARSEADAAWQALRPDMRVFRLPGIYGPGRNPLDRIASGKSKRVDVPGQVFSRIHVDDIVSAIVASFDGPSGVYNISDDLPAPQHEVVAHGAKLLGIDVPPLVPVKDAELSEAAKGFYEENRRVSNEKAKKTLKWELKYPDYKAGLASLKAL